MTETTVETPITSAFEPFEFTPFKATTHPKGIDNGLARVMMHDYGFCLIAPDGRQASQFSCCRAYIVDIYMHYYQGSGQFTEVHWYKEYAEPDTNNIRIGLGLKKDLTGTEGTMLDTEIPLIVDFLNKIEAGFGFEPTKAYHAVNGKKSTVYMLVGDKKWLTSAALISLYGLLIRNCAKWHKLDNTWEQTIEARIANPPQAYDRDNQPMKDVFPYIKKFVKFNPMTFFKVDPEFNFHKEIKPWSDSHNFGIHYLSTNTNIERISKAPFKAIMAYAHRFKTEEEIQEFLNKEPSSVVEVVEEAVVPVIATPAPTPIGVAVNPRRKRRYTKRNAAYWQAKKTYRPEGVLA